MKKWQHSYVDHPTIVGFALISADSSIERKLCTDMRHCMCTVIYFLHQISIDNTTI